MYTSKQARWDYPHVLSELSELGTQQGCYSWPQASEIAFVLVVDAFDPDAPVYGILSSLADKLSRPQQQSAHFNGSHGSSHYAQMCVFVCSWHEIWLQKSDLLTSYCLEHTATEVTDQLHEAYLATLIKAFWLWNKLFESPIADTVVILKQTWNLHLRLPYLMKRPEGRYFASLEEAAGWRSFSSKQ